MTALPILTLVLALTSSRAPGPEPLVAAAGATISPAAAAEILKKSDVAAHMPRSFRARLRITALREQPDPMDVEVWRSGESKSLVRFLGDREKGKYLLRLDQVLWLLAPGARKPVKVSPAYRLRGSASLEEILGIRFALDYVIEGATEAAESGLVVMDLAARSRQAPYQRVRYFVRAATQRPVRAEYLLPSGKTSCVVEFLEWEEGRRPVVRRLVVTDRLRHGLRTEVKLLEMEEREIPDSLFDLEDPTERKKLE